MTLAVVAGVASAYAEEALGVKDHASSGEPAAAASAPIEQRSTGEVAVGPVAGNGTAPARPVFKPNDRAVSTWRSEAAANLSLTPNQIDVLTRSGAPPSVGRCVKLNNYWCIKKAGWNGEIAADGEGHVAFASAQEGAAVAALLLKRYYLDFKRRSALAIVSHWAPTRCGQVVIASKPTRIGGKRTGHVASPTRLPSTLRGRWLANHSRGFVTPVAGRGSPVRRSVVADRIQRSLPAPTIAVGLGEATRPMTLDALLMSSPNAPPSRSMLGLPQPKPVQSRGAVSGATTLVRGGTNCSAEEARIASYAVKAAIGIVTGPNGDLQLFTDDGKPTPNLALMMGNMARVEIGPLGAKSSLVEAGIAAAFAPGRNANKS